MSCLPTVFSCSFIDRTNSCSLLPACVTVGLENCFDLTTRWVLARSMCFGRGRGTSCTLTRVPWRQQSCCRKQPLEVSYTHTHSDIHTRACTHACEYTWSHIQPQLHAQSCRCCVQWKVVLYRGLARAKIKVRWFSKSTRRFYVFLFCGVHVLKIPRLVYRQSHEWFKVDM